MSELCETCGRHYEIVYRVPNDVWTKITPRKDGLGPHPEHQYGGLLCPDCAAKAARDEGIELYFEASTGDWAGNHALAPVSAEREAIALYSESILPPDGWASTYGDDACWGYCEAGSDIAAAIRARTDADAQAALDRVKREAREKALRDVVELMRERWAMTTMELEEAITDMIEKDKTDGV